MQDVTCKFCLQLLEEPVLLQCKHPICSKCAHIQFSFELVRNPSTHFPLKTKSKHENMETHDDKHTVDICCPVCNEKTSIIVTQGITKLTRDLELEERLKKVDKPAARMCIKDCGNQAELYCESCRDDFCNQCFNLLHFEVLKNWKNHKTTIIDASKPPASSCPAHGYLLDRFCEEDQVACCYKCFESGEHNNHKPTHLSRIAEQFKKQAGEKLVEIEKQIKQVEQTINDMDNLKEQVSKSRTQFTLQIKDNFDRVIKQLEKKRDALMTESEDMETTSLSNISLHQEALADLLEHKSNIVEQVTQWLSGDDLQVSQAKQLLEKNKEIISPMLICCENSQANIDVDVSQIEQAIDNFVSIHNTPVDTASALVLEMKDEKDTTLPPISDTSNNPRVIFSQLKQQCPQIICEQIHNAYNHKKVKLNLSNCIMDDSSATMVAKMIPYLTHLQQLYIADNQIGDVGATAIADSITNLTQLQLLHIGSNQIGDSGATSLAAAISNLTQLQQIRLSNNQIGESGATEIAKSIRNLAQLQRLDFDRNKIRDSGAAAIAIGVQDLPGLQQLNLGSNLIGNVGSTAIAHAITNLTQLHHLQLHQNQIGDQGATAIGNTLCRLTQLQHLHLYENQIGDTGIRAIANAISSLTKLQNLGLSKNQIGDTGAIAIVNAASNLKHLQKFHLYHNKISEPMRMRIEKSRKGVLSV